MVDRRIETVKNIDSVKVIPTDTESILSQNAIKRRINCIVHGINLDPPLDVEKRASGLHMATCSDYHRR